MFSDRPCGNGDERVEALPQASRGCIKGGRPPREETRIVIGQEHWEAALRKNLMPGDIREGAQDE